MLNHCIMAHFHKMRSRLKEDFKNVVLLKAYMTRVCSKLYHSFVSFSGLQFTSTSDALTLRVLGQGDISVSCFSLKISMDPASEQDLCCTHWGGFWGSERQRVWFRDSHWALQGGSLVLMLSWKFWSFIHPPTFTLSHTGVCSILHAQFC